MDELLEISAVVPINKRVDNTFEEFCNYLSDSSNVSSRRSCKNLLSPLQTADIQLGEGAFSITYGPFPMDSKLLASRARLTSWWPDALSYISSHEATLRISTKSKPESRLTDVLRLTELTRNVAKSTDCAGVYWGDGIINSKEEFMRLSENVRSTKFVSKLWVNIKAYELDDGSFLLGTYGLEVFDLPDIEIDGFRADVPGAVIAIICQLLDSLILGGTELKLVNDSPPPLSFGDTVYGVLGNSFMNSADVVCKLRWSGDNL